MFKKLISSALCGAVVTSSLLLGSAAAAGNDRFTVKSVHCPEGKTYIESDYQKFDAMILRYKDDKTPIPLSAYRDEYMFATVPSENKNREIEVHISEEVNFVDKSDENSFDFFALAELSRVGVVKGDEKGCANPYDNITRAEAAAMVMRFIGVENSAGLVSSFTDVPVGEWYAGAVAAAEKYGIVKGDSAGIFSPQRNVSREEMTAMAARAVWAVGLKNEDKTVSRADLSLILYGEVEDADAVSDWALSAYDVFSSSNISDYREEERYAEDGSVEYTTVNSLVPSKSAQRHEAADLLRYARSRLQVYPSQLAVKYGFDKKMPVIDGSTSTYPFTEAVYRSLFLNGDLHSQKPQKHSKSYVSYQKLIAGETDAIVASVYPSDEILAEAKANNVELELIPIAYDAMVFFTNADNPVNGLTKEQISKIYVNNAFSNWNQIGGPDALLYPYARNYDSGSHAQMQRHFLNGGDIHEKIRKETTSVAMADVLTDVMGAKTDNPKGYALGYSIYYYFNNMDMFYDTKSHLKLLEIDGVKPNDDTIADGSYPLSNNTYVVIRKNEPADSNARKFAEFMLTEVGQLCVAEAGFGPLKK